MDTMLLHESWGGSQLSSYVGGKTCRLFNTKGPALSQDVGNVLSQIFHTFRFVSVAVGVLDEHAVLACASLFLECSFMHLIRFYCLECYGTWEFYCPSGIFKPSSSLLFEDTARRKCCVRFPNSNTPTNPAFSWLGLGSWPDWFLFPLYTILKETRGWFMQTKAPIAFQNQPRLLGYMSSLL